MKQRVSLRSNTVGESVRMKLGVISQSEPRAIFLRGLCYRSFFTPGKVFPAIVASDSQERPIGALEVLHQNISRSGVAGCAGGFAQHLFQLLAMAGNRTIIRYGIN